MPRLSFYAPRGEKIRRANGAGPSLRQAQTTITGLRALVREITADCGHIRLHVGREYDISILTPWQTCEIIFATTYCTSLQDMIQYVDDPPLAGCSCEIVAGCRSEPVWTGI